MSISAVQHVANVALPAGGQAVAGFDPNGPNLGAALNDTAHKVCGALQSTAAIEGELLAACNDSLFAQAAQDVCSPNMPASPRGLFAQNALNIGVSAAITAGAAAISPALGVVVAGAAAAHGVISSIAGGVGLAASHEPPPHAALTSAASYTGQGFYVDAEGLAYDERGLYVSMEILDATKMVTSTGNAGAAGKQFAPPQPMTAAQEIVAMLGAENVRDQLSARNAQAEKQYGQLNLAHRVARENSLDLAGGYHLPRVTGSVGMRA